MTIVYNNERWEAVLAMTGPKTLVSDAFQSDSLAGVAAVAGTYNAVAAAEKATKYVADIKIAAATGVITMTTRAAGAGGGSSLPPAVQSADMTMQPNVAGAALVAGATGPIDWACATSSNFTATAKGLVATVSGTPVPAKYAPAECR